MRIGSIWSMDQIGRAVLRAGRGFLRFAGDVVNSGREFEQAIANLRAVVPRGDQFGDGFDDLKERIKELGATTMFTATEVASGGEMLAKAGLEIGEVYAALPATLELATAGALSLSQAADIATNVMRGFGKSAEELGAVVDTLAFAASNSNTTVAELGRGFSFLSSVVRPLGVSLESSVVTMAKMADVGIKGGRAGRNLATALSDIVKKSGELNIKLADGNGKMKQWDGILRAIGEAGLSTTDILAEFSKRTSRTILALRAGGGDLTAFAKEAERLGLDVFNAEGNLKTFNEVLEVLEKEGLTDLLDLIPSAADEIEEFTKRADASGLTLKKASAIAEKFGLSTKKLEEAILGSSQAIKVFGMNGATVGAALVKFKEQNIEGAEASDLLKTAMEQLSKGAASAGIDIEDISGNLLEFDDILKIIAERGLTSEEIIEHFGEETARALEIMSADGVEALDQLTEEMRKLTGEAEGMGSRIADIRADTLTGQLTLLGSAFNGLKTAIFDLGLGELLTDIAHGITVLVNDANDFVEANKVAIATFFAELRARVIPTLTGLRSEVAPIMQAIGEAFSKTLETFLRFAQGLAKNKDVVISVFRGISTAVGLLVDAFLFGLSVFNKVPEPIRTMTVAAAALAVVIAPMATLVRGFGLGVLSLIAPVATATKTLLFMATGFAGPVAAAIAGGIAIVTALALAYRTNFGGIRDAVQQAVGQMMPRLIQVKNFLAKVLPPALTFVRRVFGAAFEFIGSFVASTIKLIGNQLSNFIDFIGGWVEIIGGIATGNWVKVWEGFKQVVASAVNSILGFVEFLVTNVLSLVGNFLGIFNKGLKESLDGAAEGVRQASANLQTRISQALTPDSIDLGITKETGEAAINALGEGILSGADNLKQLVQDNLTPTFRFEDAGEEAADSLAEGMDKGKGGVKKAAEDLAKEAKEAFDNQLKSLAAKLELGVIKPEQAKRALEAIKTELLQQVQVLKDAGKTGTEAFTDVAERVGQVQGELDKVNEIIAETIKQTHGVTKATTTWLNKLQAQSDLGLRPLVEIYDELETRATEVFAEIEKLQEGGLTPDELPIFEALVEKHEAIINVLDSVGGKLEETQKLERELADEMIASGSLALEKRIEQINTRIAEAKDSKNVIEQLEEELSDRQKELSDRNKEFTKAEFEFKRGEGELTRDEIREFLQEELDATLKNTAERIAARKRLSDAEKQFAQEDLALEEARLGVLAAQGQSILTQELALAQKRLELVRGNAVEEQKALTDIANLKREIVKQEQEDEDRLFELSRLRGEASLQDELNREREKLDAFKVVEGERIALFLEGSDKRVEQLTKIANLEKQLAQEQSQARKDAFAAAKEDSVDATEAIVAEFEARLAAFQGSAAEEKALEEDLKVFRKEASELRQKQDEEEAENSIEEAEKAHRHKLAMNEIELEDHLLWLRKQIAANKDNVEKRRKFELEYQQVAGQIRDKALAKFKQSSDEIIKTAKERTQFEEEQEKERVKVAEDAAKEREKAAKELAKKTEEIEKELHKLGLELNQEGLQDYIGTLRARAGQLEKHGKTESEEYKQIQERITEADELFHKRRVELAIKEADQKLAENEDYKRGYIEELERIMHSEGTSVEDRIDLAKKLAKFKLEEFGKLSEDEIQFLENILATEKLNADEIKDITAATTEFRVDNAEESADRQEEQLERILKTELDYNKSKLESGEQTLKESIRFLEDLLHAQEWSAEQKIRILLEIAELEEDLSAKSVEVWERDTKAIVDSLRSASEATDGWAKVSLTATTDVTEGILKVVNAGGDVQGVMAGVMQGIDALTSLLKSDTNPTIAGTAEALATAGAEAVGLALGLPGLGQAFQGLIGLAGGLSDALSSVFGRTFGDVASVILTGPAGLFNIFRRSSKAAKKAREEARKFREEMEKLQQEVKDWASDLGNSLSSTFTGIDVGEFIKITLGSDINDGKGFLDDFARGLVENILKARAKVADALANISDNFDVADIFSIETGEITDEGLKIVGEISQFAGRYVTVIEDIQQKMLEGTNRISAEARAALDRQLGEAIGNFEEWIAEFERASDFLGGGISSSLFDALTDPEVSMEKAADLLDASFKEFVLKTILDMATQAVLASGVVAAKMADLTVLIEKAIKTGKWDAVTAAVAETSKLINDALMGASESIKEGVGGLIPDEAIGDETDKAAETFKKEIEAFKQKVADATSTLGGFLSTGLNNMFVEQMSLEDAGEALDRQLKDHIINMIIQAGVDAVLATAGVANNLALLGGHIADAIQSGDWTSVSVFVTNMANDLVGLLDDAGNAIGEGLKGLVPDKAAEEFKQAALNATNTLSGFVGSNLFKRFVEGETSLEDAGKLLERQFKDHVIQTIIDTAVEAAFAAAIVGEKMAGLPDLIKEALTTGDWSKVTSVVDEVGAEILGEFSDLGESLQNGLKGLIPDHAAEKAAEKAKEELEQFEAKVSDATSTISGLLSNSFYQAITDPSTSFEDATRVLDRQFKEHVIKTIIDLGVQSVLASAIVAEDLVKLSDVINKAIASGDWSQVTSTVSGIGHNLLSKFSELSISIRDGVEGLLPEEDNFAEVFNQRLEAFKAKIEEATNTLSGLLSSNLSEAIFNPEVSLADAGIKLGEDFDKFVIQTILDMATKAALATGTIASQMVGLSELIEEAITEGNWDAVKSAVTTVAEDLKETFAGIAENVGGALNEVFNKDITAPIKVDAEQETDVKIELDEDSVRTFAVGTHQLNFFANTWGRSIEQFGGFISSFSLSTSQLQEQFLPNLDTGIGTFSGASNTFKDSVGIFDAGVKTFDNSVVQDTTNKQEFNRKLNLFADRLEGIFNEDAFARLRS